jgi:hypothetical protein
VRSPQSSASSVFLHVVVCVLEALDEIVVRVSSHAWMVLAVRCQPAEDASTQYVDSGVLSLVYRLEVDQAACAVQAGEVCRLKHNRLLILDDLMVGPDRSVRVSPYSHTERLNVLKIRTAQKIGI